MSSRGVDDGRLWTSPSQPIRLDTSGSQRSRLGEFDTRPVSKLSNRVYQRVAEDYGPGLVALAAGNEIEREYIRTGALELERAKTRAENQLRREQRDAWKLAEQAAQVANMDKARVELMQTKMEREALELEHARESCMQARRDAADLEVAMERRMEEERAEMSNVLDRLLAEAQAEKEQFQKEAEQEAEAARAAVIDNQAEKETLREELAAAKEETRYVRKTVGSAAREEARAADGQSALDRHARQDAERRTEEAQRAELRAREEESAAREALGATELKVTEGNREREALNEALAAAESAMIVKAETARSDAKLRETAERGREEAEARWEAAEAAAAAVAVEMAELHVELEALKNQASLSRLEQVTAQQAAKEYLGELARKTEELEKATQLEEGSRAQVEEARREVSEARASAVKAEELTEAVQRFEAQSRQDMKNELAEVEAAANAEQDRISQALEAAEKGSAEKDASRILTEEAFAEEKASKLMVEARLAEEEQKRDEAQTKQAAAQMRCAEAYRERDKARALALRARTGIAQIRTLEKQATEAAASARAHATEVEEAATEALNEFEVRQALLRDELKALWEEKHGEALYAATPAPGCWYADEADLGE